ncbi:DNA/RNA non-specific endonuclease [Altererythrobacter sp. CAU 1778]
MIEGSTSSSPVRQSPAATERSYTTPAATASTLLARHRAGGFDASGLQRDAALLRAQLPGQAQAVEAQIAARLTPREAGEYARAWDTAQVCTVPAGLVPQQAPANDPGGPSTATVVADLTQMTLDLVGIVEPTPFADGSNALISLGRMGGALWNREWGEAGGHLLNGTLSAAGVIPYLGDAAKAGKIGKWAQTVADAVTMAARNPAARGALEAPLREIRDLLDKIPQGAIDAMPGSARESLERMRTQLDEFFDPPPAPRAIDTRPQIQIDGGSPGNWSRELNAPNLRANADYQVNGYTYRTNADGQVEAVSGRLDLSTAERNGYQQRVAGRDDRLESDQGGHLIASIFSGPGERVNLVPMDGNLNMGRWRSMEDTMAAALREGRSVDVNITVRYPEGSARPNAFRVEYTIDGNTQVETFRNRPGGN